MRTERRRTRLAVFTLVPVVALSIGLGRASESSRVDDNDDDRDVIAAILEHTVRPDHARQVGAMSSPPPIFVFNRTSRVCKASEPESACVPSREVGGVFDGRAPVLNRPHDQVFSNVSIPRELIDGYQKRNQTSHVVPRLDAPDVVMVSANDVAGSRGVRWGDPNRGYWTFSRPAYAKQDYALVYCSYGCGPFCGHGYLFVLKKTSSSWKVAASALLWIS
jgi:hypothetical protein